MGLLHIPATAERVPLLPTVFVAHCTASPPPPHNPPPQVLNFLFGSANLRTCAVAWAVVIVARLALVDLFRPEPPPASGKLRILMVGDSFAPKVDGVATRTSKGEFVSVYRLRCAARLVSARDVPPVLCPPVMYRP